MQGVSVSPNVSTKGASISRTTADDLKRLQLRGVLARRPVRLTTVALANKMARIAWALLTHNDVYRAQGRFKVAAGAAA